MSEMISFGANFVKIYDGEGDVYLIWKCNENVILNDRVVEEAKKHAVDFVLTGDIMSLYEMYAIGWKLYSVESA